MNSISIENVDDVILLSTNLSFTRKILNSEKWKENLILLRQL